MLYLSLQKSGLSKAIKQIQIFRTLNLCGKYFQKCSALYFQMKGVFLQCKKEKTNEIFVSLLSCLKNSYGKRFLVSVFLYFNKLFAVIFIVIRYLQAT